MISVFLIGVVTAALLLPLSAWFTTIGFGMLHSVLPAVPALGWTKALIVAVALRMIIPMQTSTSTSK